MRSARGTADRIAEGQVWKDEAAQRMIISRRPNANAHVGIRTLLALPFALSHFRPYIVSRGRGGGHETHSSRPKLMANVLFYTHSGLRFLVLMAAAIAVAVLLWGWRTGRPLNEGQARGATAVFLGTLDLQVLLGILLVLTRPFYGALIGHLVMMVAAAIAAHGIIVYARKVPDPRRGSLVAMVGVLLALLLIVGGIMSIRPSPLHMTPGAGATATSTG